MSELEAELLFINTICTENTLRRNTVKFFCGLDLSAIYLCELTEQFLREAILYGTRLEQFGARQEGAKAGRIPACGEMLHREIGEA